MVVKKGVCMPLSEILIFSTKDDEIKIS